MKPVPWLVNRRKIKRWQILTPLVIDLEMTSHYRHKALQGKVVAAGSCYVQDTEQYLDNK